MIVNKGDEQNYNVRCRLVGQELKAKTKEALLAYELFSAMPPWEIVKCLFPMLVTDDVFETPVPADGLEPHSVAVPGPEELQSPVSVPGPVQELMKADGTVRGANDQMGLCCTTQHFFIGDLDDKDDDGELEIGVFDISRAHFMAKAQREL